MLLAPSLGLVLASIPSPSTNKIGPFTAYGLMIAIGVICGVWLARNRWAATGGDPEDITVIALWAVPAGLIGARLYHVITDNQKYRAPQGTFIDAFKIWNGGLGIPGGILLGVAVGVFVAYKKGLRLPPALDAVAPALPLAQAIGRFGNYFNQELFGRPTELPWGLQIDPAHRPVEYAGFETFQPTFLYEALWNLALMGVLIWLGNKKLVRPGRLFVLYVGGYFLGRLWVESLRSDDANLILGLRINIWISLICIIGAAGFLLVYGLRRRPDDSDEPYRDGHRFSLDGTAAAVDDEATTDAPDRSNEDQPSASDDVVVADPQAVEADRDTT